MSGQQETILLDMAEARRLLMEKHGVAVGSDDPMLMAVTLHQAFMADYETMLGRHADALCDHIRSIASDTAGKIDKSAEKLRDDLLESAVKNVMAGVAEHAKTTGLITDRMRRTLFHLGILTVLNWLAALIGLAALFFILK